jgi:hypothetical protein
MRQFISSNQWIERVVDSPEPGVHYYDGAHRGFVPVHRDCRIGAATAEEMRAAETKAIEYLNARRAYAQGKT